MKFSRPVAIAAVGCIALAACGRGEPKGQVLAVVGDEEVTALQLQEEMGGFRAPNAAAKKAAEQRALNQIVARKLLAEAAREEEIEKSPEFARQRERMTEALLVQTWQAKLARAVPTPSLEEAQQFISQNPDVYAARKRMQVEGLTFVAPPNDQTLLRTLQPLKTLDAIRAVLTSRNIPFRNGSGELDPLALDPRIATQLLKLPPGEVFVLPQGNALLVAQVVSTRVDPVPNEIAIRHATQFLKGQRTQEAINRRFGSIVTRGMTDVKYAKGFTPPSSGAAPPAKAPPKAAPGAPGATGSTPTGAPGAPAKAG
jgi:EpsD family peptidyl-prolyl cis-trans isomerase